MLSASIYLYTLTQVEVGRARNVEFCHVPLFPVKKREEELSTVTPKNTLLELQYEELRIQVGSLTKTWMIIVQKHIFFCSSRSEFEALIDQSRKKTRITRCLPLFYMFDYLQRCKKDRGISKRIDKGGDGRRILPCWHLGTKGTRKERTQPPPRFDKWAARLIQKIRHGQEKKDFLKVVSPPSTYKGRSRLWVGGWSFFGRKVFICQILWESVKVVGESFFKGMKMALIGPHFFANF